MEDTEAPPPTLAAPTSLTHTFVNATRQWKKHQSVRGQVSTQATLTKKETTGSYLLNTNWTQTFSLVLSSLVMLLPVGSAL